MFNMQFNVRALLFAIVLIGLVNGQFFQEQPIDLLVPKGSTIEQTFSCRAKSDIPSATYSWRFNGAQLNIEDDIDLSLHIGDLTISNVDDSRAGEYQCKVESQVGSAVSQIAILEIEYLHNFDSTENDPIITQQGVGVVIPCNTLDYSPENSVAYYWMDDQYHVISPLGNATYMVSQENGNLYIGNPTPYSAQLACYARSIWTIAGTAKIVTAPSTSFTVTAAVVNKEPSFMVSPIDRDVTVGGVALLECFASGNPTPEITWTTADGNLAAAEITPGKGQMLFTEVDKSIAGTYICTANSSMGSISTSATITVQYPPEFVEEIVDVSADRGNSVTWVCTANANPTSVSYEWYRDDVLLSNGIDELVINTDETKSTLTLSNLQEEDSAVYQCIAENNIGRSYSSSILTVNSQPPVFVVPLPAVTKVARGNDATIPCDIDAAPVATITWYRGDTKLKSNDKYSINADNSLVIRNVTNDDAASYSCYANNSLGNVEGSSDVKVYNPTTMLTEPGDLEFNEGITNAVLSCTASFDQALGISWTWKQNGVIVSMVPGSPFVLNGNSLTILTTTSAVSGSYECIAENVVGAASGYGSVVVNAPPNPPLNVVGTSAKSDSYELKWYAGDDNNSPILQYIVVGRNSRIPDDVWVTMTTEPEVVTTTTCNIVGLFSYNKYVFRVKAVNALGEGDFSEPSPECQTLQSAPTSYPLKIRGGGGELGQLIITWDPLKPVFYGSDSISYHVSYYKDVPNPTQTTMEPGLEAKETNELEPSWIVAQVPNDPTADKISFTVQVGEDEVYQPYVVKIQAFNNIGDGPYSKERVVHTAETAPDTAPEPPLEQVNLTKAYQIGLRFTPLQSKNGMVRGYYVKVVQLIQNQGPVNNTIVKTNSPIPAAVVTGLNDNQLYDVFIAGYNSAGMGPYSVATKITTEKKPPRLPPQNVDVTIAQTIVTGTWDGIPSMKQDEADLCGYVVQYWPANKTNDVMISHKTIYEEMKFGLPVNGKFKVWVRGYSAGGFGTPSAVFTVSTDTTSLGGYAITSHPSSLLILLSIIFYWTSQLC